MYYEKIDCSSGNVFFVGTRVMAENLRLDIVNYWADYDENYVNDTNTVQRLRAEIKKELFSGYFGGVGMDIFQYPDLVGWHSMAYVARKNVYLVGRYEMKDKIDYAGAEIWYRGYLNKEIYFEASGGFRGMVREPYGGSNGANQIYSAAAEARYYYNEKIFSGLGLSILHQNYKKAGINHIQTIPAGILVGYQINSKFAILGGFDRYFNRVNADGPDLEKIDFDKNIYSIKVEVRL